MRQRGYEQSTATAGRLVRSGHDWERRRPSGRRADLVGDVAVPALQAAMTAAVVGIVSGAVLAMLHAERPALWGLILALVALALAWAYLLADHRALLWDVERTIGRDIDGDGWTGDPVRVDPRDDMALVYVRDPGADRRRARAADWRFFLSEAYGERGTTWRAWDGMRLPSGATVTRPTWDEYTERLLRAGLATRSHATAALELTGTYRDALAAFREAV